VTEVDVAEVTLAHTPPTLTLGLTPPLTKSNPVMV
jgi:hypothetical protein